MSVMICKCINFHVKLLRSQVMMKWKPVDLGCVTLNTNGFVSSYSGLETCGMKGAGEYVGLLRKLEDPQHS